MELVNGFVCKNCTDVDYAKKGIDPAHPKAGPRGAQGADGKTSDPTDPASAFGPAIRLSGVLSDPRPGDAARRGEPRPEDPARPDPGPPPARRYTPGAVADISA